MLYKTELVRDEVKKKIIIEEDSCTKTSFFNYILPGYETVVLLPYL